MYILHSTHVLRISDNAYIPLNQDNRDYQEYLNWVSQGNTPVQADTSAVIIAARKLSKKQEIRDLYEADCNLNVSHNGFLFQGGFDSAIKLDAAKRLAEAAGQTEVTFYDATNAARILSIQDALMVVLAVASDYQQKFSKKQAAMVLIDAAKTLNKINQVSY